MARTGFADFWELSKTERASQADRNYVPLIIAMTIMAKNPKDYDLDGIDLDEPVAYDSLNIAAPTHLALIADATARPVSEIQDLNPALTKLVAPAGYQLRVPAGSSENRGDYAGADPGGASGWLARPSGAASETLESIARRYSTSFASISAANHKILVPEPGDLLVIPAGYPQRAGVHPAVHTVTHSSAKSAAAGKHKSAHRTTASRRSSSSNLKTAAVSAKHRPGAN